MTVKLLSNVSCAAECLGCQCGFGQSVFNKAFSKRRYITRE